MTPRFRNFPVLAAGLALLAAIAAGAPLAQAKNEKSGALARMAAQAAFNQFKRDFWPRARRAGIRRHVYVQAMQYMTPDWDVLRRMRNQAEFRLSTGDYVARYASAARIATGRQKLTRLSGLLGAIERRYGVDRHVVLAIWGMETNYGTRMGDHNLIRALATLAFSGRRKRYGRAQLIAALKILQRGDVTLKNMKASWAGAFGHTQFIPTTYLGYAQDFNGDGRRDVWNTLSDALASTAHYLKRRGWRRGLPWGWEVRLPANFPRRLIGRRAMRSVGQWARLGVRPAKAKRFYALKARAWLIRPAGRRGPAFLVTRNFRALLAYNNAVAYALAVGILADRIAGGGPPARDFPASVQQTASVR